MVLSTLLFGILSGCFLSVLVGILGSRRRIGFGWAFLISVLLSPLIGLIVALISDPLPESEKRWGCIGVVIGFLGFLCLAMFLFLLLTGAAALTL